MSIPILSCNFNDIVTLLPEEQGGTYSCKQSFLEVFVAFLYADDDDVVADGILICMCE